MATVRTREPDEGIAYERFTATGPVALLPIGDGYALVWTVPTTSQPACSHSTTAIF